MKDIFETMGKFNWLERDGIVKEFLLILSMIKALLPIFKKFLSIMGKYWTVLGWNGMISGSCFKILQEKKKSEDMDEPVMEKYW